jgi:hypothetical protein
MIRIVGEIGICLVFHSVSSELSVTDQYVLRESEKNDYVVDRNQTTVLCEPSQNEVHDSLE